MIRSVLFLCLFSILSSTAQNIKVNSENSHEAFVKTLSNSKDDRYNAILQDYDKYLEAHPNDVDVQIYRCKFIGSAYYDEYEDYNLKYDETEQCINSLVANFPRNSKVLIYKLNNTYGEERETLLQEAIALYESKTITWDLEDVSLLFEIGAYYYQEEDDYKAVKHANLAEKYNDTLDLSILKTRAYLRLENEEKAKESILEHLDKDQVNWVLNTKGELLIELNQDEVALKLYDRIKAKDSTFSANENLYQIFLQKENYQQARTYLVNDTIQTWNKVAALQKLANHDLKYSEANVALLSLRRMYQESYYDDFLAIKRIRLALKSPSYFWSFGEIMHVLILVLFVLLLLVIPYLWVLPVYSLSNYFDFKKIKSDIQLGGDWTLRHFWLISFLYLLTLFIIILVFNYQEELNYYFDILEYLDDFTEVTDLVSANAQLLFSGLLLLSTLVLLNKKRLRFVFTNTNTIRQTIGLSILFIVFNAILIRILGTFIDLTEGAEFITTLSAKEEIQALLREYGFYITVLVVAVIVPFYEEIIFRGIILTATHKHLGFKMANTIQACLFALIHFNLSLFIYYFIFGLVTGYFVKRSQGLTTGIVFHMVNNFIVTFSLYYTL